MVVLLKVVAAVVIPIGVALKCMVYSPIITSSDDVHQ